MPVPPADWSCTRCRMAADGAPSGARPLRLALALGGLPTFSAARP
ncbi:hypothetical protein GZL_04293 [Streptomyces sp. 769]|nr:hypothetical protein GZL_04293 [Streptomyces sp. 769]